MHAHLRGPKSLLTLYQIINKSGKPDFPYLANEIAEPRLDMNIKVAAFTVSKKSSNIHLHKQRSCIVVWVAIYLPSQHYFVYFQPCHKDDK